MGHSGNGGRGTISILRKSSVTKSYPAYKYIKRGVRKGLRDEDSLVYIAGTSKKPPKSNLKNFYIVVYCPYEDSLSKKEMDWFNWFQLL